MGRRNPFDSHAAATRRLKAALNAPFKFSASSSRPARHRVHEQIRPLIFDGPLSKVATWEGDKHLGDSFGKDREEAERDARRRFG